MSPVYSLRSQIEVAISFFPGESTPLLPRDVLSARATASVPYYLEQIAVCAVRLPSTSDSVDVITQAKEAETGVLYGNERLFYYDYGLP